MNAWFVDQRIHQWQLGRAGIAEYILNALCFEYFEQDIRAVSLYGIGHSLCLIRAAESMKA